MSYGQSNLSAADQRAPVGVEAARNAPPTLVTALKALEDLRSLLEDTSVTAGHVADALGGSVPADAAKGERASRSADGIAEHLLSSIAVAIDHTHHLRQHIARIQSRVA